MEIIRSVNGVEISEEDFKKLNITNPTLERIFARVKAKLDSGFGKESKVDYDRKAKESETP